MIKSSQQAGDSHEASPLVKREKLGDGKKSQHISFSEEVKKSKPQNNRPSNRQVPGSAHRTLASVSPLIGADEKETLKTLEEKLSEVDLEDHEAEGHEAFDRLTLTLRNEEENSLAISLNSLPGVSETFTQPEKTTESKMARKPRVYILCEICDKRITNSHKVLQCTDCDTRSHATCISGKDGASQGEEGVQWTCKNCHTIPECANHSTSPQTDNTGAEEVTPEVTSEVTSSVADVSSDEATTELTPEATSEEVIPEQPAETSSETDAGATSEPPSFSDYDPIMPNASISDGSSLPDVSQVDRLSPLLSSNTLHSVIDDVINSSYPNTRELDLRCSEVMPDFDDSILEFRNRLECIQPSSSDSDSDHSHRYHTSILKYDQAHFVDSISDIFRSACFSPTSYPYTANRDDDPASSSSASSCSPNSTSPSLHYTMNSSVPKYSFDLSECLDASYHPTQSCNLSLEDRLTSDPIANSTQNQDNSHDSQDRICSSPASSNVSTASSQGTNSEQTSSSSPANQLQPHDTVLVTDRCTDIVEMLPSNSHNGDMKVWMVPSDVWQQFLDYRASLRR